MILDDIALLGLKPDLFTFTSDHFDRLLTLCSRMIEEGKAYVDDTDPETMKKEREERTESKNRNNCRHSTFFSSCPVKMETGPLTQRFLPFLSSWFQ